MTAVLPSDRPSHVGGNAISLNRDVPTYSIREQKILLIRLTARGQLKMKSGQICACVCCSPLSPCEGRDVSVKTGCLGDWPSSKQ